MSNATDNWFMGLSNSWITNYNAMSGADYARKNIDWIDQHQAELCNQMVPTKIYTLPLSMKMTMARKPTCLADFEEFARQNLQKVALDYLSSGADQEQTLLDNTEAFKRIRLCPRVLIDVSERDLSTTILGERVSFPVAIAPSSYQCLTHPDGEVATARAAASVKTVMGLSAWSTKSLEEVATAVPNSPRWLQVQFFTDESVLPNLVRRAEKVGFKAIVITLDNPTIGRRLADIRNNFQANCKLPNLEQADKKLASGHRYGPVVPSQTATWKDVDGLRKLTSLPIIAKGILTAADAKLAVEHGVAGIVVSNHGGRQLDGVLATIDALPEVVEAVRGSGVEVYMDGGIRKGTDVLKALAMGARAVFIGRPVQWGLCYKGEEGVRLVLELLKNEFSSAMALTGCTDAKNIPGSIVKYSPVLFSRL